jgi:hypothetical protein
MEWGLRKRRFKSDASKFYTVSSASAQLKNHF